jgi:hypothetical protein
MGSDRLKGQMAKSKVYGFGQHRRPVGTHDPDGQAPARDPGQTNRQGIG